MGPPKDGLGALQGSTHSVTACVSPARARLLALIPACTRVCVRVPRVPSRQRLPYKAATLLLLRSAALLLAKFGTGWGCVCGGG